MVNIDDLIETLCKATYINEYGNNMPLIRINGEEQLPQLRLIINSWCNEQESKQVAIMAELEAKVKAYEAIISNSNFSMAITENKENTNDDLLETEILEPHGRLVDSDMLYASIAKDTYLLTDESDSRDYGMFLIDIRKKIDKATTVIERNE